jgi:hypothetical protein
MREEFARTSPRKRYCATCKARVECEREATEGRITLIMWSPVALVLAPLLSFIGIGVGIWKGYGFVRVWWLLVPALAVQLVWVFFHTREYSKNPFRCVTCRRALPY